MRFPHTSPATTRAFSLVELSIVLVIIGVLIGGIISGTAMIKAAQLRSVATDANAYINAIATFRDQYRYLPGDMPTAVTYWAASANGNADGLVTTSSVGPPAIPEERYRFWQHLNLAGLIDKSYTGATGGGGANDFVIGTNVPNSRIDRAGFSLEYTITAASGVFYAANLGNSLSFGAAVGENLGAPISAILIPEDAYNIDMKVDDGIPGTGKWIANLTGGGVFGTAAACADGANNVAGTYNFDNTAISCSFFILTGY